MTVSERMASALERIADALEAQNAADPLTMLSAVLDDDAVAGEVPTGMLLGKQEPLAGNGLTVLYRHPTDPALQIVARRDRTAEGGYSVGVEKA
jgi:hypothetical protein